MNARLAAARGLAGVGLVLLNQKPPTFAIYDKVALSKLLDDEDAFWEEHPETILGFMDLSDAKRSCGPVYQVSRAAGKRGYGPLIYDIAMSMAARDRRALVSDRTGQTSSSARRVWSYYYNLRRSDVELIPLSDACGGEDELGFAYRAKKPFRFQAAEKVTKQLTKKALDNDITFNPFEFQAILHEAAESFAGDLING